MASEDEKRLEDFFTKHYSSSSVDFYQLFLENDAKRLTQTLMKLSKHHLLSLEDLWTGIKKVPVSCGKKLGTDLRVMSIVDLTLQFDEKTLVKAASGRLTTSGNGEKATPLEQLRSFCLWAETLLKNVDVGKLDGEDAEARARRFETMLKEALQKTEFPDPSSSTTEEPKSGAEKRKRKDGGTDHGTDTFLQFLNACGFPSIAVQAEPIVATMKKHEVSDLETLSKKIRTKRMTMLCGSEKDFQVWHAKMATKLEGTLSPMKDKKGEARQNLIKQIKDIFKNEVQETVQGDQAQPR